MGSDLISQGLANVRARLVELQDIDQKLTAARRTSKDLAGQVQTQQRLVKTARKKLDRLRRRQASLNDHLVVFRLEVVAQAGSVAEFSEQLAVAQGSLPETTAQLAQAKNAFETYANELAQLTGQQSFLHALPVLGRRRRKLLNAARIAYSRAQSQLKLARDSEDRASKAVKTSSDLLTRARHELGAKVTAKDQAKAPFEDVRRAELETESSIVAAGDSLRRLKTLLRQAAAEVAHLEQRRAPISPSRLERGNDDASQLSWEILPQGCWLDPVFLSRLKDQATRWGIRLDTGRLVRLGSLSPRHTYRGWYLDKGTGTRQYPYHVFEYERVAIADCQQFGNALYYTVVENWREVFRLTKRDALRNGARRLIHRGDWFARVQALVSGQLSPRLSADS